MCAQRTSSRVYFWGWSKISKYTSEMPRLPRAIRVWSGGVSYFLGSYSAGVGTTTPMKDRVVRYRMVGAKRTSSGVSLPCEVDV